MIVSPAQKTWGRISRGLYLLILIVGALIMVIPFLWSLSTSLKPLNQALAYPPRWIPHPFLWKNYIDTWKTVPMERWFLNSTLVSVVVVIGNLLLDALAGYALARIHFRGRNLVFFGVISMLMIPFQSIMLPVYIELRSLGLINSYAGMILPQLVSAMGVFLMRQAFLNIPEEVEESAVIEGASRWRIFWQITLPMVQPTMLTLALMMFMSSWNNFLLPLLVANKLQFWTLPLGMVMFQQQYYTNWPYLMAAAVMATIPIAILFLIFQKWFIQGISTTGLK
ncbi:carbohydrate ABC transporter permease [Alicyclobacillus tolerans]|uniref:Carbohydrate ABC transporter membrane protein 2, CUT1 family n=2 Tax=Alicyclobacillus tolerans TaxID=90970 RepID=A0A1M6P1E1_9BACL|nr:MULTISPECIES: carbohydrate ABC transporter permease [Alicyclobacillus]MDP9729147.1 multiple sugar transport system permease protein [Alicyclobacillus tengchongensis]SHK01703.1 carbohydrate ABC transporter membrane protein 2, CUT1 family [Alicyclobacillus montanus]